MVPAEHVAGVSGRKPAAAGEPPQHSAPHLGGDGRERLRRQILSGSELDLAVGAALKHPVEDAALETTWRFRAALRRWTKRTAP